MTNTAVSKFLKAFPISLFLFLVSFSPTFAQTSGFKNDEVVNGVATIKGFETIISNLLVIAISLAGIVLFIMFIIGGFKYLTSSGDPKQAEAAKGTLTHAIIGLVVIILGFLFLQIIKFVTGVDITVFNIVHN